MTVIKCDMCGKILDASRFKVQMKQLDDKSHYIKQSNNVHDLCEECAHKVIKIMEEGVPDV